MGVESIMSEWWMTHGYIVNPVRMKYGRMVDG
jgi:hypothetical protein